MPPLIRRRPLLERLRTNLDPYDFLLWLSEELNDNSYDELLNAWATPIGLASNLLFILARGASRNTFSGADDVFSEHGAGRGWFSWLSASIVHSLTILCCLNAFYTFTRKKHYRLFEQHVDVAPSTPSARRVRVDDSPATNSPLQYLREAISNATRGQHAADAEKEVWEVGIWDAKPFNLTLFTFFSPGHLLVYYTLLPTAALDPRPSVTVLLTIAFGVVLSLQLGYLRTLFDQQTKDKALIQGEVLNEYNTKFVHPSLHRMMRDVSTQTRESALSAKGTRTREVDVYTPTVVINRGFSTNPNTNYSALYSAQAQTPAVQHDRRLSKVAAETPVARDGRRSSAYTQTPSVAASGGSAFNWSSPLKPSDEKSTQQRRPQKGDVAAAIREATPRRQTAGSHEDRLNSRHRPRVDELENSRRRQTGRFA
ncbi:hypothetical protein AMS68_006186 [Peltaster fructicola]|uniref:Nuclear rim protein 1 n=1 Tax=Peltaster fructicola TaxID=286661 RepID=A0A6H0Y1C8_9PEZI|nr:hypothetical protein AMS68_006186 [Peltaster fructicola]